MVLQVKVWRVLDASKTVYSSPDRVQDREQVRYSKLVSEPVPTLGRIIACYSKLGILGLREDLFLISLQLLFWVLHRSETSCTDPWAIYTCSCNPKCILSSLLIPSIKNTSRETLWVISFKENCAEHGESSYSLKLLEEAFKVGSCEARWRWTMGNQQVHHSTLGWVPTGSRALWVSFNLLLHSAWLFRWSLPPVVFPEYGFPR